MASIYKDINAVEISLSFKLVFPSFVIAVEIKMNEKILFVLLLRNAELHHELC